MSLLSFCIILPIQIQNVVLTNCRIKMKKTLMTLAILFVAVCANAQVFVGGTAGVASTGGEGVSDETTFKILPEIGYNINSNWAVGAVLGYEKGSFSMLNPNSPATGDVKAFEIAPYARYTFLHTKVVNLFVDGGIGFASGTSAHKDFTAFHIGLQPGLTVNLNSHISLVSKVGFLGYEAVNPEGDHNNTHAFGLGLNGNNIQFGVYYNF